MSDLPVPDLPRLPPRDTGGLTRRVADADRDRTVTLLREHVVEGRLTLDEFSERVGLALEAQTRADLDAVDGRPSASATPDAPDGARLERQSGRRPERPTQRRWHVAVMSGHSTKGRWRISRKTNAVAVMGGCDMDLRRAEIEGPEVEITAVAFWGGVKIIVPEGFDVELRGFSLMGGRELQPAGRAPRPRVAADRRAGLRRSWAASRCRAGPTDRPQAGPGRRGRAAEIDAPGAVADARRPGCARSGHRANSHGPAASTASQRGPPPRSTPHRWHGHHPLLRHGRLRRHDRAARRPGRHASSCTSTTASCARPSARHGGREINVQGDGFMVAFGGVARALRCAVDIQQAFESPTSRTRAASRSPSTSASTPGTPWPRATTSSGTPSSWPADWPTPPAPARSSSPPCPSNWSRARASSTFDGHREIASRGWPVRSPVRHALVGRVKRRSGTPKTWEAGRPLRPARPRVAESAGAPRVPDRTRRHRRSRWSRRTPRDTARAVAGDLVTQGRTDSNRVRHRRASAASPLPACLRALLAAGIPARPRHRGPRASWRPA